ncbi:MAG: Holliday junction resolvase RuvX [Patescibacteria group bacterium]
MKLLGLDYGESKVGLAIGDTESRLALPIAIIENNGKNILIREIFALCQKERIDQIILGLPTNTQSNDSQQTQRVKVFYEELKKQIKLEVVLYDERFSSQEAQKLRPGKCDDDVAAMIILQSYLDKFNINKS